MPNLTSVITNLAGQALAAKLNQNKSSSGGLLDNFSSKILGGKGSNSQSNISKEQHLMSSGSYPGYGANPQSDSGYHPSNNQQGYYSGPNPVSGYPSAPSPSGYPAHDPYSSVPVNVGYSNHGPPNAYGGYPNAAVSEGAYGSGTPAIGFNLGSNSHYNSTGYPPASGQSPYPPVSGQSPYPPAFGQSPYPPASGQSPYPPASGQSPYPSASGGLPYQPSAPLHPPNFGNAPYNPTATGYLPGSGNVYPTHVVDSLQHNFGNNLHNQSNPQTFNSNTMSSRPTIHPSPNFNANATAELLRKAMKGFGCNNAKVIQALCTISNWQRQEVVKAYKVMYGKDLINDLKSELSGDFENLILALIEPPAKYDARQLHSAIEGLGTKESVLIEILTTRSNGQIQCLKGTYRQMYGKELESDLIDDTSGHFQRLLISMCAGGRDESNRVDPLKANQDARALYRAGEQRLGTDESSFNAILASQNPWQLRMVFEEYTKTTGGSTIEKAITNEFSDDIRDGLLAIVKSVQNRPAFFAELLNNSIKGFGTRDTDLIRLIVTRSEVDLADICDAYQSIYNTSLEKAIAGDCSGNYKDALIAIVRGN